MVLSPAVPGVPGVPGHRRVNGARVCAAINAICDTYRSGGQGPVGAKFAGVCGFEAPADGAPHEPAGLEPPSAQESANGERMLVRCLRPTTRYRPGLSALRAAAVGGRRPVSLAHRTAAALVRQLGTPLVEFPATMGASPASQSRSRKHCAAHSPRPISTAVSTAAASQSRSACHRA